MTRISVHKHHFLDITSSVFFDVDKHFRETKDMLFVTRASNVIGIITHSDYLKAYYSGALPDSAIDHVFNPHFIYLYDDQLKQADAIFYSSNIAGIPVFNKTDTPVFVLYKTHFNINQCFYCGCLTGFEMYNFSINSDLSLSCHCVLRRTGELGNLKNSSLIEIFQSDYVNRIRQNFSDGFLLTTKCLECPGLISAPKSLSHYYSRNYSFPKTIMIENTSVCNLKCKNCYNAVIEKTTISVHDFEVIAKELKELDVNVIELYKYGETFADKHIGLKVDIIRKYLPDAFIRILTNGMLLDTSHALDAALKVNRIVVSLDGSDDASVAKFQSGSRFSKVIDNMSNFIKLRNSTGQSTPVLVWKLVLFEWNDSEELINRAFLKAAEIGVDKLQFVSGWNVKPEEMSTVLHESRMFLKYLDEYKFEYTLAGGGTFTFDIKK